MRKQANEPEMSYQDILNGIYERIKQREQAEANGAPPAEIQRMYLESRRISYEQICRWNLYLSATRS